MICLIRDRATLYLRWPVREEVRHGKDKDGTASMTAVRCPRCRKVWTFRVSPLPKDDERSAVCPECAADEARTVKRES